MAVIFCLAPSLHFTNCLQQSFSKLWFVQSTATGEQRRSGCDRHWKSNSLFVHVGKITGRGRHVIVANLVKLGSWRSHWWRPKATFMMPPTITILLVFFANWNTNAKSPQIVVSPNNFANWPIIALKSRSQTVFATTLQNSWPQWQCKWGGQGGHPAPSCGYPE